MSLRQRTESLVSYQDTKSFSSSRASNEIQTGPYAEEKVFSLFQPDILLPAQYFATTKRKDHLEPEKKLMLAVLEDAVWCFQNCLRARDKGRKSLFSEAEEWIMTEDTVWLFSFQNVCEALGLNPKYVRTGLMRWKEKALASRVNAKVYRLTHIGERKNRAVAVTKTRGHKFLKAAGF